MMPKKILIIGSGGREHAIGWKIRQDSPETALYFAPGNGGTAQIGENIKIHHIDDLIVFAKANQIQLTIVGSEKLLSEGIVDRFLENNLIIFGPDQSSAKLESSKAFAKEFMKRHSVKTAAYESFVDYHLALRYLETQNFPIVIKASGLAEGKGVIIAENIAEAEIALKSMMIDHAFGNSGTQVVIEQYIQGFEVSIMSIFNGNEIYPFLSAQDHKKIGEAETGYNTGGMGVIAPNPKFTEKYRSLFEENILKPTLAGLKSEYINFSGFIFFGLICTEEQVYLLEYNLRLGDPETQALMPLLESNLVEILQRAIAKQPIEIKWSNQSTCCVVLASGGYPFSYQKGFEIKGLNQISHHAFFAGIDENLKTSGGRVLHIVAQGNSLEEAIGEAYQDVEKIQFQDCYFRKDIGQN
ncbi:MAG: phosphoribosylamine--glycine ligase [Chitinophagales bacterium]|jgi:phosphoribosylamine--glycine ligase|nr:phosphoribosylamine--glycine ligase [Chitinophagales bacterium]